MNPANKMGMALDKILWDMGTMCFDALFEYLSKSDSKSMAGSREVLREREKITSSISTMSTELEIALAKAQELEAMSKRSATKIMMQETKRALEKQDAIVLNMIAKMQHGISRLEDIALRPDPRTVEDHIDELIQRENSKPNRDAGRVQQLQRLKAKELKTMQMQEASENPAVGDLIQDFSRNINKAAQDLIEAIQKFSDNVEKSTDELAKKMAKYV